MTCPQAKSCSGARQEYGVRTLASGRTSPFYGPAASPSTMPKLVVKLQSLEAGTCLGGHLTPPIRTSCQRGNGKELRPLDLGRFKLNLSDYVYLV